MKTLVLTIIFLLISAGVAIACQPEILPSIVPSIEPSPEISLDPTVPVDEPTITLEPTPTAGESGHVDVSDGRSDGLSSCPECTKAPVVPVAPPDTSLRE